MEEKIIEIIEAVSGCPLKENRDVDLFEKEILDSLAFLELITALEEEFHIEIQPTQVDPNIWRSVGAIAGLVETLEKAT